MSNSVVEQGKVRFNEFDGLLGTESENAKIKALYTLKDPNKKIYVVFLKGFSVGINWTVSVEKNDIKAEERDDLEPNTMINQKCLEVARDDIYNISSNKELLIIWDGDNYDKTCYTQLIPDLLKKLEKYSTYTLIAYRSANFEEFKRSWISCPDIDSLEINIVKGPLITGNHYEDLAVFGREKTATFLNPDELHGVQIISFGGGPILEAELTPRLPFTKTEIVMYNVTRIRGEKGSMFFQRNYIFKDIKYDDRKRILMAKRFFVSKDERAICKIENGKPYSEMVALYAKTSQGPYISVSSSEDDGGLGTYYKDAVKVYKSKGNRRTSARQASKKASKKSPRKSPKKSPGKSPKKAPRKSPKKSHRKSPKKSPRKSAKKAQKRSRK